MNRVNNKFIFKANIHKVGFDLKFFKRIYALTVWLRSRYKIEGLEPTYEHTFVGEDYANGLITIIIDFDGNNRDR